MVINYRLNFRLPITTTGCPYSSEHNEKLVYEMYAPTNVALGD